MPAVLHEDAGPYSKGRQRSLSVLNFSSLLAVAAEIDCKFVMGVFTKCLGPQGKLDSDDESWRDINDSLYLLATGVFPFGPWHPNSSEFKRAGSPICLLNGEPISLCIVSGKADAEQQVVGWGAPSYNSGVDVCGRCDCDRGDKPFTNLVAVRARRSYAPKREFLQRLVLPIHPIMLAFYFTRYFLRIDIMHNNDNNGVISILAGEVMVELAWTCDLLGQTIDERLAALNTLLVEYYERHNVKHRIGGGIKKQNLHLGTGVTDSFPQLCGPNIKSAPTRAILPFIRYLVDRFYTGHDQRTVSAKKCVQAVDDFVRILYDGRLFLDDEAKLRLDELADKFARHFQWLSVDAVAHAQVRWHVTPKVHTFMHISQECKLLNARFVQRYLEESLVGMMEPIATSCCNGPILKGEVQRSVLVKVVVGIELRWQGYE